MWTLQLRAFSRRLCLISGFLVLTATGSGNAEVVSNEGERSNRAMGGLYSSFPEPSSKEEADSLVTRIKQSPQLSGLLIGTTWDRLEPSKGNYDFSSLDSSISVARRAGKNYKLKITPGSRSPDFLYELGTQRIRTTVSNPNRSNFGDPISVPVPWDPVYQEHFSRLIKALGARYGTDPFCNAVTLTCANFLSAEMHLPDDQDSMRQWARLGMTWERLLKVYQQYLREWAAAFPEQLICLHMSKSVGFSDITEHQFSEKIVLYAMQEFPDRFALQNNGLHGRKEDIRAAQPDNPIMKYKDTRLLNGLQSFASFNGNPVRQGSIEMAVLNYMRTGSEYWEMGALDGLDSGTTQAILLEIKEARRLGVDAYRKLLKEVGLHRTGENDVWPTVAAQMKRDKAGKRSLREMRALKQK